MRGQELAGLKTLIIKLDGTEEVGCVEVQEALLQLKKASESWVLWLSQVCAVEEKLLEGHHIDTELTQPPKSSVDLER